MISIINNSHEVQHNKEKAQNELLTLINATVSHELRNPLNSITAINIQKEMLYQQLEDIINDHTLTQKQISSKLKPILIKMRQGKNIQQTSTKLIQFLVQDLLDYAQINQNKFRINVKEFNLINSINEIISIQSMKAEDKNIILKADFDLLWRSVINHDELRI